MTAPIEKLPTGIEGFDYISRGGLPRGRTTLVAGTAGSAKTVFASQFLAAGIERGEPGVFVTFEETPDDLRRNMQGFGWDIARWEAEGLWAFVDASPHPDDERLEAGLYDFSALSARVKAAVERVRAKRVSLDSVGAVFAQYADASQIRPALYRLAATLRELEVTAILTAERTSDHGEISRFGVEEFVADNVILLRNVLAEEKRQRTVEILKFRGTDHQKGQFPFSVLGGSGIQVIPLTPAGPQMPKPGRERISTGNAELDAMCGGGLFADGIVLLSGATGTGKTLLGSLFAETAVRTGERALIYAFEESREQLVRNAASCGIDLEAAERSGRVTVVCEYPEVMPLEDHLIRIKQRVRELRPHRVLIDSMSALDRIAVPKNFREFVVGLSAFVKAQGLCCLLTSTTPQLTGGSAATEAHVSSIADGIILLRYVELSGEVRRGLTVLKLRGSVHERSLRELIIDSEGLRIGRPFRNVAGILSGAPAQLGVTAESPARTHEHP